MINLLLSMSIFVGVVLWHRWYCQRQRGHKIHAKEVIVASMMGLMVYVVCCFIFNLNDLPLAAGLMYVLFIPSYLIIYVTMFLESPSRLMLEALSKQPLNKEALLAELQKGQLIDKRLIELRDAGLVVVKGNSLMLTASGQYLAKAYQVYAVILGARMGG